MFDSSVLTIIVIFVVFLISSAIAKRLTGGRKDPKSMVIMYFLWLVIFLVLFAIVWFGSEILYNL